MPTFDFQCSACGHVFEHFLLSSESPEDLACEKCQAKPLQKLMSVPQVIFKGSGFYKNDAGGSQITQRGNVTTSTVSTPPAELPKNPDKSGHSHGASCGCE